MWTGDQLPGPVARDRMAEPLVPETSAVRKANGAPRANVPWLIFGIVGFIALIVVQNAYAAGWLRWLAPFFRESAVLIMVFAILDKTLQSNRPTLTYWIKVVVFAFAVLAMGNLIGARFPEERATIERPAPDRDAEHR